MRRERTLLDGLPHQPIRERLRALPNISSSRPIRFLDRQLANDAAAIRSQIKGQTVAFVQIKRTPNLGRNRNLMLAC